MTERELNFFYQMSMRLCTHLEIESALQAGLKYLAEFMPADGLFLQVVDKEFNAFRIMVHVNHESTSSKDVLAPLPDKAKAAIINLETAFLDKKLPRVIIVNNPEEEPITSVVQKYLKIPPSSVLSMHLATIEKIPATLALIAQGNGRYSQEDADLFGLLKEAFFPIVSSYLRRKRILHLIELLEDDKSYFEKELNHQSGSEIIGADFGLKSTMEAVQQVAPLESSVLILGETGTGKEIIASTIHQFSQRAKGPFIKVNCGAIPDSLIDSELFGHEKGSFTGAVRQKRGRFERANGGSIFLDEVGELPPAAQVRLLRVLQEKKIERVGGSQSISVDIRVIAATHRDLPEMVKRGEFREDLYFRLKVFPIHLPPLRQRRGDIPALIQYFIEKKSAEMKLARVPGLKRGAMEKLIDYDWPGNVRELENLVERALILTQDNIIDFPWLLESTEKTETSRAFIMKPEDRKNFLSNIEQKQETESSQKEEDINDEALVLDSVIREHIEKVLLLTNGRIEGPGGTAELLDINPATLRNRMKKLGIEYGRKTGKSAF